MKVSKRISLAGATTALLVMFLPALPGTPAASASTPRACPTVQVFVVAGTYAFNAYRTANPGATIPTRFLPQGMEKPIQDIPVLTDENASYFTVDYPATDSTLQDPGGLLRSHDQGVLNTTNDISTFVQNCPNSSIALFGYSQGAWIAGDVATNIGNNLGPVPASKVVGSFLMADPVQTPGYGTFVGPAIAGTGVLTPRNASFGSLNSTTFELCAMGDLFCNSSVGVVQALAAIGNPAHTTYDQYQVAPGTSATEWIQAYLATHVPLTPSVPVVIGGIGAHYQQLGGQGSYLGLPISIEHSTPDGVGRYVRFQYGSIYWTPQTGAWAIHGWIDSNFALNGWENGAGYPTSDEIGAPDGVGRFETFLNQGIQMAIYWTPQIGAHLLKGSIYQRWLSLGSQSGALGYPTSDEFPVGPNGADRQSNFQHGSIYWTQATNTTIVTYS